MKLFFAFTIATIIAVASMIVTLHPGEGGTITCAADELILTRDTITSATYSCVAYTPTPRATATEVSTAAPMATNTPAPTATPHHDHGDEADLYWHAPGAHGDRPAHEHGDAPPQWLLDSGVNPTFTHVAGTPNENYAYYKHTGFKGVLATLNGVEFYGVFHWDFNPSGHDGRFHSYQIWLRDATGAISHMHGWQDFGTGNNTNSQKIISCGTNSNVRPIINVNQPGCSLFFETWYARAGGSGNWSIDTGVSINPNYYAGGDPSDPTTWQDTGYVRNLTRRLELAWYADRSSLKGSFVTDQWGRLRTGMNDPVCGTARTIGTRTYTVVCLRQYIAPTLTSIVFPGNALQRTWQGANVVELPN